MTIYELRKAFNYATKIIVTNKDYYEEYEEPIRIAVNHILYGLTGFSSMECRRIKAIGAGTLEAEVDAPTTVLKAWAEYAEAEIEILSQAPTAAGKEG